jgi:hypothetical protein
LAASILFFDSRKNLVIFAIRSFMSVFDSIRSATCSATVSWCCWLYARWTYRFLNNLWVNTSTFWCDPYFLDLVRLSFFDHSNLHY